MYERIPRGVAKSLPVFGTIPASRAKGGGDVQQWAVFYVAGGERRTNDIAVDGGREKNRAECLIVAAGGVTRRKLSAEKYNDDANQYYIKLAADRVLRNIHGNNTKQRKLFTHVYKHYFL